MLFGLNFYTDIVIKNAVLVSVGLPVIQPMIYTYVLPQIMFMLYVIFLLFYQLLNVYCTSWFGSAKCILAEIY